MILVTGGSGFIGSHLVEKLLSTGKKVINIGNFNGFYEISIKIRNTLESTGSHLREIDDEELSGEKTLDRVYKGDLMREINLAIIAVKIGEFCGKLSRKS